MPPVELQTVRVAVDLDHHAALGRAVEDAVELDAVALAAEELAAGEVAEEGDVRVVQGAEDALRHLVLFHLELGVDGGDDEVEEVERFGTVVDGAVGEDVRLRAAEDANRRHALLPRGDLRLP